MTKQRKWLAVPGFLTLAAAAAMLSAYAGASSSEGNSPTQPVNFPHTVHAGTLKMNCVYCHFSATKSKLKSAEDTKKSAPKSAPKAATKPRPVEDYQTPPEQPAGRDGNLLDALDQMKPLIAQYGPDQVKRMVDLLG